MLQKNKPTIVDILDEEYEMPSSLMDLQDAIDENFELYQRLDWDSEKRIKLRKKLNELVAAYNSIRKEKIFKQVT